jgi:hypothetical protein
MYSGSLLLPLQSLILRFVTGEKVIGYTLIKAAI